MVYPDESLTALIQERARHYHDDTVAMRRHLHRHPELSTEERETVRYIARQLAAWHIPYQDGLADTGLCATIQGLEPDSRCVALRADMDALPITEQTGLPFASETPGVMHACGHDAHMACLLGTARILQETKDRWKGTVKLIFQPSEEDFRSGAPQMIAGGVLENPKPQHIYAMHVLPDMPAGKVGMKAGQYMASTDELYLTVKGKGGHAGTQRRYRDSGGQHPDVAATGREPAGAALHSDRAVVRPHHRRRPHEHHPVGSAYRGDDPDV